MRLCTRRNCRNRRGGRPAWWCRPAEWWSFSNTVRVSGFSLGGGQLGEYHRLIGGLDGLVHGPELEH
jgi:hypothetical protein